MLPDKFYQEYLQSKTSVGESKIIIGIYLEAEDFEYYRKYKRLEKSSFVINAINHFRLVSFKLLYIIYPRNTEVRLSVKLLPSLKKSYSGPLQDSNENFLLEPGATNTSSKLFSNMLLKDFFLAFK